MRNGIRTGVLACVLALAVAAGSAFAQGKPVVNLNTATAAQLQDLPVRDPVALLGGGLAAALHELRVALLELEEPHAVGEELLGRPGVILLEPHELEPAFGDPVSDHMFESREHALSQVWSL